MKQKKRALSGLLLLDKAKGISSNHLLIKTRGLYRAQKAGHGGTLDPFAEGLLPILFGEASKFSRYFLGGDKTYRVTMRLGQATDTQDLEGEVVKTAPLPNWHTIDIPKILQGFLGKQKQRPPIYSALKVDGKRAYELARKGEIPELALREITIHSLELLTPEIHQDTCELSLRVRCSAGTYIRTLVQDLGEAFGSCAHAIFLRREAVNQLTPQVDFAHLQALRDQEDWQGLDSYLLPLEACLSHLPCVSLSKEEAQRLLQGQRLRCKDVATNEHIAAFYQQRFLGIVAIEDGVIHPRRLLSHVAL